MMITIYLIRHGKTSGNLEKRYIGRTDEELSQEGRNHLEACRHAGIYPKASLVYTSDMKRCIETARFLFPSAKIVPIEGLREMDFGLFEGKNYAELCDEPAYRAWIDSVCEGKTILDYEKEGNHRVADLLKNSHIEDQYSFMQRNVSSFEKILQDNLITIPQDNSENSIIVCVIHGGSIMSILSTALQGSKKTLFRYTEDEGTIQQTLPLHGAYYDFQIKNGDCVKVEYSDCGQHNSTKYNQTSCG